MSLRAHPAVAAAYRTLWDLRHPSTKFVFLATTGRSGSQFMDRVFSSLSGVASAHEPYPIMNGPSMIAMQQGDPQPAEHEYRVRKSVNMRRLAGSSAMYCECNHMFVKSFFRFALDDLGERARVIHLRRDSISVARSMAELPYIPGEDRGNLWYLDWRAPENLIGIPDLLGPGAPFGERFERCLWYWYEIESRIEKQLRPLIPEGRFLPLFWKGSFEPAAVSRVLDGLGLSYDPGSIAALCERKVNQQVNLKEEADAARVPRPEAEERAARFKEALSERFGELPGFSEGTGPDAAPAA